MTQMISGAATTAVNKISAFHAPRKMRFMDLFNSVYYYTPEEVAKFINDAFDTGRRYEASLVKCSPAETGVGTPNPGKAPAKQKGKPNVKFNAQVITKKPAPAKAPAKKNNSKPLPSKAKPKAK